MQFINLFCCFLIISLSARSMDRKRSIEQTEPNPKKCHRTDPALVAELRILQNIAQLHSLLKGYSSQKINTHGQ